MPPSILQPSLLDCLHVSSLLGIFLDRTLSLLSLYLGAAFGTSSHHLLAVALLLLGSSLAFVFAPSFLPSTHLNLFLLPLPLIGKLGLSLSLRLARNRTLETACRGGCLQ